MTSPTQDIGYCAECARLRKAYLQAVREAGHWEALLHPEADVDPENQENIREELQRAEDIRIAAREAWLNHQTTAHGV